MSTVLFVNSLSLLCKSVTESIFMICKLLFVSIRTNIPVEYEQRVRIINLPLIRSVVCCKFTCILLICSRRSKISFASTKFLCPFGFQFTFIGQDGVHLPAICAQLVHTEIEMQINTLAVVDVSMCTLYACIHVSSQLHYKLYIYIINILYTRIYEV